MKYTHCNVCGKEKNTPKTQMSERCRSCSNKEKKGKSNGPMSEEQKQKISKTKKGIPNLAAQGKKHSEEHRRKMSEARKGIPSPLKGKKTGRSSWMKGKDAWNKGKILGPYSIERRIINSIAQGGDGNVENRKHGNTNTWRKLVKERDGHCYICLTTEKLEAHHILHKAAWPELATDLNNGITLCAGCHRTGPNAIHRKNHNDTQKKETN